MVLGSLFIKKLRGDTACDLWFWEAYLSKNLRGTLLAICDLVSLFVQKLTEKGRGRSSGRSREREGGC